MLDWYEVDQSDDRICMTYQEERKDDTPDKHPLGDTEPHVHGAIVPALPLNSICPLQCQLAQDERSGNVSLRGRRECMWWL